MSTPELKENIGVYTDPAHNLWIDPASPSVDEIKAGSTLEKGEVVVAIRSTGICGYETIFLGFYWIVHPS